VIDWTLKDYWQGRDTHAPLPDDWDSAQPDSADAFVADESVRDVLRSSLDGRALEVCQLRYLDGLEIEQIADRLGMTRNAVDQALFRAHARLREALVRA
jgi:RNA polymerase sigma factor (sigma-70 family)